MQLTEKKVLDILRSGTLEERIEFLRDLPSNGFKAAATGLIGSENPGMVILALASLIQQYCNGSNPACGAVLASAAHERAVEICETVPNHGLILSTLSGLAHSHLKALTLLGRSEEVIKLSKFYIYRYEAMEDSQNLSWKQSNLPSLKVLQIEALINLKRIDEAEAALQDPSLHQHPIAGVDANRLKGLVNRYLTDCTSLKSEMTNTSKPPSVQSLLETMKTVISLSFEGEAARKLGEQVDQLDPNNRINLQDPAQFNQLLEVLKKGEDFLTREDH